MAQQDSIVFNLPANFNSIETLVKKPARPQTPYQVLRLLPKDATPAQQDSAIQAWFEPGEIHYSERPDTLHLPGQEIPRDLKTVNIPQYYRENYFSNNPLYHEEIGSITADVAGDPVPYVIHNDSIITSLLILCFLFITFVMSRISGFLLHQAKYFFYISKGEHTLIETGNEIRFQLFFMPVTCLLLSLAFYFYAIRFISDTFILNSEYLILAIFTAMFAGYFGLKALLYTIVNNVFFDNKKNLQFLSAFLFILSMEGVLLFPLVLLMTYFQFSVQNSIYYFLFTLCFTKILTFYKSNIIFFNQKELFLQNILYFCALEMIPLSVLWTALLVITNSLKVNF